MTQKTPLQLHCQELLIKEYFRQLRSEIITKKCSQYNVLIKPHYVGEYDSTKLKWITQQREGQVWTGFTCHPLE